MIGDWITIERHEMREGGREGGRLLRVFKKARSELCCWIFYSLLRIVIH
jgi:hypothetical protein